MVISVLVYGKKYNLVYVYCKHSINHKTLIYKYIDVSNYLQKLFTFTLISVKSNCVIIQLLLLGMNKNVFAHAESDKVDQSPQKGQRTVI